MQHEKRSGRGKSGRRSEPLNWHVEVVVAVAEEAGSEARQEAMDIVAQWIRRTRPIRTASSPDR